MEQFVESLMQWVGLALTLIGAASVIVQGLAQLATVTPSTRDDEIMGKVQGWLATVARILDKVALNLPADKARPAK